MEPPPTPGTPGREQRRHPRFELFAAVEIVGSSETLILHAVNISLGGVLLASDGHSLAEYPVGASVDVLIFDPQSTTRRAVRTPATVVRHEDKGMALQWEMGESVSRHLGRLLKSLNQRSKSG